MTFSNWSGLVVSDPAEVREVATVDDVRRAVGDAAANGWVIRTAGTEYSISVCWLLRTEGNVRYARSTYSPLTSSIGSGGPSAG